MLTHCIQSSRLFCVDSLYRKYLWLINRHRSMFDNNNKNKNKKQNLYYTLYIRMSNYRYKCVDEGNFINFYLMWPTSARPVVVPFNFSLTSSVLASLNATLVSSFLDLFSLFIILKNWIGRNHTIKRKKKMKIRQQQYNWPQCR